MCFFSETMWCVGLQPSCLLRLLINCLFRSLKQFLWSALLLLLAIYVVAIYICQASQGCWTLDGSHSLSSCFWPHGCFRSRILQILRFPTHNNQLNMLHATNPVLGGHHISFGERCRGPGTTIYHSMVLDPQLWKPFTLHFDLEQLQSTAASNHR